MATTVAKIVMYNLMRDLKQFNDSKFKGVGI